MTTLNLEKAEAPRWAKACHGKPRSSTYSGAGAFFGVFEALFDLLGAFLGGLGELLGALFDGLGSN